VIKKTFARISISTPRRKISADEEFLEICSVNSVFCDFCDDEGFFVLLFGVHDLILSLAARRNFARWGKCERGR
jgi:hypothetical protein